MRSESSLRSELDEAVDAVLEEHDLRQLPGTIFEIRPEDLYRPPRMFRFDPPAPAQYVVPRRFGMSAILGIITALAILFGSFRSYGVEPVLYLFFGVEAIVICLAQMFYGRSPRAASAVAGAVLLPLFLIAMSAYQNSHRAGLDACAAIASIPMGALLGYVTGTLAAGVFLVMDAGERLLMSLGRSSR